MRELERHHDDKLNIIRSMAIPINNLNAESSATPAVAAGKGTPRRRPPTPYAESNENEEYHAFVYEHTETVQVKKRCQSEERLLQVIIIISTTIVIVAILVIRSVTFVTTRSRCCTEVSFTYTTRLLTMVHSILFLDDFVCELNSLVFDFHCIISLFEYDLCPSCS